MLKKGLLMPKRWFSRDSSAFSSCLSFSDSWGNSF